MIQIDEDFTVPAYFPEFACKCGACRHTCCQGLAIRISQEEYFHMVGEDCPPDVRADLDLALHTLGREADPGRYAELSPDFRGQCRLLGKDGLCRLQAACGSGAISAVCRLYPRRPQLLNCQRACGSTLPVPEMSMTNACEATLELLRDFAAGSPVKLISRRVAFELADLPLKKEHPDLLHELQIHRMCVRIMGDETLPFAERARRLKTFAGIVFEGDREGARMVQAALCTPAPLLVAMLEGLAADRPDLAPAARSCRPEDDFRMLTQAESTFLGRVMANDLFLRLFPYGNRELSPLRAVAALIVIIRMLLILTALPGGAAKETGIDRMAAFFRMVELTDFDAALLRRLQY